MHSRSRIKLMLVKIAVIIMLTNGPGHALGAEDPRNSTVNSDDDNAIESTVESTKLPESTEVPATITTTAAVVESKTAQQGATTMTIAVPPITTTQSTKKADMVTPPKVDQSGHYNAPNCSQFPLSPIQPVYDERSQIKKCCPFGEMFEEMGNGRYRCVPGERKIDVETIYAVFYGDSECIEDKELKLQFNYIPNDSCFGNNLTFQYSKELNDQMFVIQNGSLLVVEDGGFMSVFDFYCVEVDSSGQLLAKACDEVEPIVLKSTAALIYIGMVIASIALVITCLAYAFVPKLNDIFGYLLVGHAGTFLVGMILMTLAVCGDRCIEQGAGGVVKVFAHVFLMSSVLAFLFMNIHNYVYAAYYLPNGLTLTFENKRDVHIFSAVLFTITIIPLFQPWRNSLIFYIILYIYYAAIAVILYLSHRALRTLAESKFIRFTVTQQNYTELTYTEAVNAQPRVDGERLKDIKSLNRLCQVETAFTLLCWIVFSSLQHHLDSQYDFYRIGAAYAVIFQGLLIGVFFLGGRKKWTIIRECWSYSGSIDLHALEMEREMKTLERKTPLL